MSKTKVLTTILLFSAFLMTAQEEWPGKGDSELGVILGANFSSFYGDDADDAKSKVGLLIGASYDYYFSSTWSLKARLSYQQKGAKDDTSNQNLNLNYLTVPINANWHFGRRKRWYLNFGPYFGLLLSADAIGQDVKDQVKSSDLGFNTGIGIKIPVGDNLMFFIESSGQSGFSSVDDSGFDADIKNTSGAFSIGLFF